jgi:hypothetical protein
MVGRLYINGRDAYSAYGIFVTEGGYNGLLSYPALKNIDFNDWAEEDGIDVDLSAPALNTMEFQIKFAAHNEMLVGDFFVLLSDRAYHTFEFREIGRTYKLRLISQSNLQVFTRMEMFSLQFANDFPFADDYKYTSPVSSIPPVSGYELDGVDLSAYGVYILQGTEAEILKSPAVKKNLLRNFSRKHGAIYDGEAVTFQQKDVRLNCLMRANTLPEFWRNYNALLFDLTQPEERSLYVDSTSYEYPCYYKACNVVRFAASGKIWFEFGITLVFTSFRVREDEYLLATEAGEIIVTEDGEFAIDLSTFD